MGSNNNKILNEYVEKMKYFMDYRVNESPKYKPLINNDDVFDDVPDLTNEANEEMPDQNNNQETPPLDNEKKPEIDVPVPDFAKNDEPQLDQINSEPQQSPEQAQNNVNQIQNDIIRSNIEAMKSLHTQLSTLNNIVNGLNSKVETLTSDVEEVREPTDGEKLVSKKYVSYPYYYNLNDFWNGNSFESKMKEEKHKGIRELPDGTYIADFDDLPHSDDIKNSFDKIV